MQDSEVTNAKLDSFMVENIDAHRDITKDGFIAVSFFKF